MRLCCSCKIRESRAKHRYCKVCGNKKSAEWRANNPVKLKESKRRDYCKNLSRSLSLAAVRRAQLANLPYDSREALRALLEILVKIGKCQCCEVVLVPGSKEKAGPSANSPSVDRLIPRLGYTVANIRLLCQRCNIIKQQEESPDRFILLASYMRRELEILNG